MSTKLQASSKTPEQNDLGKKVWSSFGFNVTPKAPQLEGFSPTDERFSEATSKTDSVFRLSEEERSSLKTLEEQEEAAFERDDYEGAQEIA